MSDKYLPMLGKLIPKGEEAQKDAIHIAVFPAFADGRLVPGEPVGMLGLGLPPYRVSSEVSPKIGIVDPFLSSIVEEGQKVWVMLFPNTITYLRHEWEHDAFVEFGSTNKGAGPKLKSKTKKVSVKYVPSPHKDNSEYEEAELWLDGFANDLDISFHELLDYIEDWVNNGTFACDDGKFEGVSVPDALWKHYETYTQTTVPEEKKDHFFSCAC